MKKHEAVRSVILIALGACLYFREQAKVDKKLDSIMEILMTISKGGNS